MPSEIDFEMPMKEYAPKIEELPTFDTKTFHDCIVRALPLPMMENKLHELNDRIKDYNEQCKAACDAETFEKFDRTGHERQLQIEENVRDLLSEVSDAHDKMHHGYGNADSLLGVYPHYNDLAYARQLLTDYVARIGPAIASAEENNQNRYIQKIKHVKLLEDKKHHERAMRRGFSRQPQPTAFDLLMPPQPRRLTTPGPGASLNPSQSHPPQYQHRGYGPPPQGQPQPTPWDLLFSPPPPEGWFSTPGPGASLPPSQSHPPQHQHYGYGPLPLGQLQGQPQDPREGSQQVQRPSKWKTIFKRSH